MRKICIITGFCAEYGLLYWLMKEIQEDDKLELKNRNPHVHMFIQKQRPLDRSNLREAWAKRRYEAHFISKLTDADGENSETDTWLDFAKDCGYLEGEHFAPLKEICESVGKMLGSMLKHPESFILRL